MSSYFEIAYVDDDVTMFQIWQLYKMKILNAKAIAYILNFKETSVRDKMSRVKKSVDGKLKNEMRMILHPGEKQRLIEMLENHNKKIAEILNQEV